jgi:hypothetical protein
MLQGYSIPIPSCLKKIPPDSPSVVSGSTCLHRPVEVLGDPPYTFGFVAILDHLSATVELLGCQERRVITQYPLKIAF